MVSSEPLLLPVSLEGEFSSSMKEMIGGCCVCSDERGWAENPLVYCDGHGCNVAVHQACYGIVQVPTGPWFCRKCESQERAARVVNHYAVDPFLWNMTIVACPCIWKNQFGLGTSYSNVITVVFFSFGISVGFFLVWVFLFCFVFLVFFGGVAYEIEC
ncbi:hypothetical protein Nmel_000259, partial [Mimus melanotis]